MAPSGLVAAHSTMRVQAPPWRYRVHRGLQSCAFRARSRASSILPSRLRASARAFAVTALRGIPEVVVHVKRAAPGALRFAARDDGDQRTRIAHGQHTVARRTRSPIDDLPPGAIARHALAVRQQSRAPIPCWPNSHGALICGPSLSGDSSSGLTAPPACPVIPEVTIACGDHDPRETIVRQQLQERVQLQLSRTLVVASFEEELSLEPCRPTSDTRSVTPAALVEAATVTTRRTRTVARLLGQHGARGSRPAATNSTREHPCQGAARLRRLVPAHSTRSAVITMRTAWVSGPARMLIHRRVRRNAVVGAQLYPGAPAGAR